MKKIKKIDVAIYIFIITGLGYFVTFLYGWGYNNYFSIPVHFIDFSILNITKSISIIGIGLSTLMMLNVFFLDKTDINRLFSRFSMEKLPRWFNLLLQFICLVGLFVLAFFITREANDKVLIIYVWIGLIFIAFYFFLKKYKKALIVTVAFIFFVSPYIIGMESAKRQTDFYLIDGYEGYVVVTFTNTEIIAAKYDSKNNVLYPIFKVLSINKLKEPNLDIKLIKINNMTIKAPNTFY